jgi:teichuronic acid biosynthesis glycosyltransferase TuaC
LNIPYVVTIHGLDAFNRCFQNGVAARWRKAASLKAYESAGKVICISDKVQRALMEGMTGKILTEVVYNGVDPDFFSPAQSHENRTNANEKTAPTILVVGTLLAGKGQELVLRAIARLKNLHPDLQCQMIGEGGDRGRFAALAKDLGIGDRVHFIGRRSRADVAEAMRDCRIFVLPSRNEGLGCVYLEAMACARPAIGCYGQGIDEIIEDGVNGNLIPVDGLDELTEKLQMLLANVALRTRIGSAARRTVVDKLTLSHQAQNLLRIYDSVV